MNRETLKYATRMPAGVEQVFAWHERPGAFERLSPPWAHVKVVERTGVGITNGARVTMQVSYGPLNVTWTVEHRDYIKNVQFCDFQVDGPLEYYEQVHRFVPESEDASMLEDEITLELPAGITGEAARIAAVTHEFERVFRYRHEIIEGDLGFTSSHNKESSMKVAVTGSTGLVGSVLVPFLTTQGHEVRRLVRPQSVSTGAPVGQCASWDPAAGELDAAVLEGCQAVVHLAGDSIGAERWNDEKKKRLRSSRIDSTKLLVKKMAELKEKPKVFVCASAIGFYGDRGPDPVAETAPRGTGFLAMLCQEWEAAANEASSLGIRLVSPRIGVVLSPAGGALQKMLLPFQMGAGGPIGSGKQYFSWISVDDVVGVILHCILTDTLKGPVNCTAPNVVTNAEFAKTFGQVLKRPAFLPMPDFAARMAFGEFADECLLASQRCNPDKLAQSGYKYRYPKLEDALRHLLGKEPAQAGA